MSSDGDILFRRLRKYFRDDLTEKDQDDIIWKIEAELDDAYEEGGSEGSFVDGKEEGIEEGFEDGYSTALSTITEITNALKTKDYDHAAVLLNRIFDKSTTVITAKDLKP